jgi:hypothetical protein
MALKRTAGVARLEEATSRIKRIAIGLPDVGPSSFNRAPRPADVEAGWVVEQPSALTQRLKESPEKVKYDDVTGTVAAIQKLWMRSVQSLLSS